MLERVNIYSNVAVYLQIENEVRYGIASGDLKAGNKLPSVRELSDTLDVNPNTVAKAYRDLEVMGLVYTRRGMGVFINKSVQGRCRNDCRVESAKRMHECVQEAKAAGFPKAEIVRLVNACFKSSAGPYDEMPTNLLSLVKK